MKKLIVLSQSDDYTVSSLIRYLIKMFYEDEIIKIFEERQIEIITSSYIKKVLNTTEDIFLSSIENKKDYLIFGIHPHGWELAINYGSGIKKIMWQDDLHYFAHYEDRKGTIPQLFTNKYYPKYIDEVDWIFTPSSIYFKNLGIDEFDKKIIDFFYFLNEKNYDELNQFEWSKRIDGVVLSGDIVQGYDSRVEFDNLRNKEDFTNTIYKIEHPGYENNKHMTELNYYKELCKYKAAFVGHYRFPINFLLAKHIEVLMCGCIGFFEPNPLLKEQLGLIEFEHYIPCFDENGLISDVEFYKDWINSDKGKKIAIQGKEYVQKKFGLNYIEKFADLINTLF
jgi:hypothetical protein